MARFRTGSVSSKTYFLTHASQVLAASCAAVRRSEGYKRYAGCMAKGMTAGDLRRTLSADAIAARTSGYVVRGVQLRIATEEVRKGAAIY